MKYTLRTLALLSGIALAAAAAELKLPDLQADNAKAGGVAISYPRGGITSKT